MPWKHGSAILALSLLLLQVSYLPLAAGQVDTRREDQLLRTALEYIENNRKGTAQIQFIDQMTGKPVNNGEVQYQQTSHDFIFSTHGTIDPDKMESVGLEWSGDVSLSWTEIEKSRGIYDFSTPNNIVQEEYKRYRLWAQFRSLLPDGQYPQAPRPPAFADFDHIADPAVFARYKELVYEFVNKAATVYRGKILAYVTQPEINWPGRAAVLGLSGQSSWTIGQAVELDKVVSKAIRDADPGAIIALGTSTPWKGPSPSDVGPLQFTKLCLDAGVDTDMVALEAWPSDGTPSFFHDYVRKLGQLGKPVFIKDSGYPSEEPTAGLSWLKNGEWKIFDEHVQALWFKYIFTFAFGMKEAAGVGLNVLVDCGDWKVGVFTTTWEPKESAATLRELMSNFTTSGTGRTDRDGVLVVRGFAGDYTLQVRDYEPVTVRVSEGQINKLTMRVSNSSIRSIEVNFSTTIGRIRSLQGVNAGPLSTGESTGTPLISLHDQYMQIGIDFVRTHDEWGAFDINIVFPNMQADSSKELSYNFTSTDQQVEAIRSIGAQVLYRIGYSFDGHPLSGWPPGEVHPSDVPTSYTKFADICRHIMMHYNHGWANGFHYDIRYWEIWNEPDTRGFWAGTPEQYFTLYDTVARTLKAADPEIRVGGPALVGDRAFLGRFLEFCRTNKSPLDFVSWHSYPEKPPYFVYEDAQQIQDLLETYGFGNVENFLTEWNYSASGLPPAPELTNARGAAWTASVLIYLQDTSVSRAFRYRGNSDNGGGAFFLFNISGSFTRPAYAFLATKKMLETPIRLACNGSDNLGFATLAGRSENGGSVRVLISNFDADYNEFALTVTDLPWQSKTVIAEIYLLDDTHDMALVERLEQTQSGSLVIRHGIRPSSVYLISLQAKEPSAEFTTRSEMIRPQTSVMLIGQSLLPLSAVLVVVSVAVISYMFKKRKDRSGAR